GTVSYMSPEQARGQKVDARSDLFSLGVVFYELLTGARPFTGATRNHVLVAILDAEPPLAEVSSLPGLQSLLSRALRKEREERYQSAREMLLDLDNLKKELELAEQLQGAQALVAAPSGGVATLPPEGGTTNARPATATNEVAAARTTSS